jgi:hypothetical protein
MKLKWTVREKELSGLAFGIANANRRASQSINDQGQRYRLACNEYLKLICLFGTANARFEALDNLCALAKLSHLVVSR